MGCVCSESADRYSTISPRVCNPRARLWSGLIRGLQTLGYSCGVVSPLLPCGWACPCVAGVGAVGRAAAVVSEGLGDPRGMCGVPVGTLTWSGLIRGSQGPSATRVEWLRHSGLRAGCPLRCGRCWLGRGVSLRGGACHGWRVRGSRGPSGDVWSTCRHSPVERLNPRVTNPRLLVWSGFATRPLAGGVSSALRALLAWAWCVPAWCGRATAGVSEGLGDPRGMCGVPIGTLTWSGLIRGLQTLGYSCGVASPLLPCGRRVPAGLAWAWWGVPRLACPRVSGTLGGCVEYLSALSRGAA